MLRLNRNDQLLDLVQRLDALGTHVHAGLLAPFSHRNALNVGIEAALGTMLGMADVVAYHSGFSALFTCCHCRTAPFT